MIYPELAKSQFQRAVYRGVFLLRSFKGTRNCNIKGPRLPAAGDVGSRCCRKTRTGLIIIARVPRQNARRKVAHAAATAQKNSSRAAAAALRLPYPAQSSGCPCGCSGLCFVFCVWGCFLCPVSFRFGRPAFLSVRLLSSFVSGCSVRVRPVPLSLAVALAVRRGRRWLGCCGGSVPPVAPSAVCRLRCRCRSRVVAFAGSRRAFGLCRSLVLASVRRRVGCFGVPCFGRVFAAEGACLPSGGLFFYACQCRWTSVRLNLRGETVFCSEP